MWRNARVGEGRRERDWIMARVSRHFHHRCAGESKDTMYPTYSRPVPDRACSCLLVLTRLPVQRYSPAVRGPLAEAGDCKRRISVPTTPMPWSCSRSVGDALKTVVTRTHSWSTCSARRWA